MAKILCRNCHNLEEFTLEVVCQSCHVPYYGYSMVTLPERFRRILEESGVVDPEPSNTNDLTEPEKTEDLSNPLISTASEKGWLILHTEGKFPVEFPLFEGVNYIGRPSEGMSPDVEITDDQYVSRGHALLKVEAAKSGFRFLVSDDANNQMKKKSLNGTHVNGNPKSLLPQQVMELWDGDTIQVGETKLVLKTAENAPNAIVAKTEVKRMDYEKTIFKKV